MDWGRFFTSPWLWVGVALLLAVFLVLRRIGRVLFEGHDDLEALIDATRPDGSHEDMGLDDEARDLVIDYLNAAWVYPTAIHYPEREHCE